LAGQILGEAIKGKRARLPISTKVTFPTGEGSSRRHSTSIISTCCSYTLVEETVSTLDQLVRDGKVRCVGASNFSGWHLMKSLAAADRQRGFPMLDEAGPVRR
jgi:aryl-alcohol dehydrogenase-like predicted oxidoreductase